MRGESAITLGEWLAVVSARGWTDEAVWLLVQDAARAALSAVRQRLRPGEDNDLVADIVVLARSMPGSWRRLSQTTQTSPATHGLLDGASLGA